MRTLQRYILSIAIAAVSMTVIAQQERPLADGRPVSFVDYKETGDWKTWSDERLSIRIPDDWCVAVDALNVNEKIQSVPKTQFSHDERWTYRVISADRKRVALSISVFRGGQEYVDCFCAPREVHEYVEKDGLKFWALTMPGVNARMFKAASKTMRLDIHGHLPKKNSARIRYIIESARPVEPNHKDAK